MNDRATFLALEQHAERTLRLWPARDLELRASGDGDTGLTLEGYACVTNFAYEMYGGPPYGWVEIVARGAFRKTLSEKCDVQLLVNHGGMPLARTKSGTLELDEDDVGLHNLASLERSDPDVQRLEPKMKRGDIDEMSMAFRVIRQRWEDEDGEEADPMTAPVRRILEINLHKGDVSVVNYGANDATSATVRDLDRAFIEARAGRELTTQQAQMLRSLADSAVRAPEPPAAERDNGGIVVDARRRQQAYLARMHAPKSQQ